MVRNGAFSAISQVITVVLGLVFAGLTIRYLGPARAGFFIVATTVVAWVSATGAGGFRAAAVKRLAFLAARRDAPESRRLLSAMMGASLVLAVPFAIVSVVAFPLLFTLSRLSEAYREDAFAVIWLGAIGFLLSEVGATVRTVYAAHQRFDLQMYTTSVFGIAGNLTKLAVLMASPSMASVAWVNLAIAASWLCVDIVLARRILGSWPTLRFEWASLKPLWSFGAWVWAGDMTGAALSNVSSFVITLYLGSAPLVYIAVPQRITNQIHQLLAGWAYFLFPTLAGAGGDAHRDIGRVEDRLRWFVASASAAAYTGLALAGTSVLSVIGGADFARHAYWPLLFFCTINAINALNVVYTYSSMAIGRVQGIVLAENVATLLSIVSFVLLLPRVGYLGVCIAQLWKIPAVMGQCAWSRRVLKLDTALRTELSPYVSPVIGVGIWFAITTALRGAGSGDATYWVSWVVGALCFGAAVWIVERRTMKAHARVSTLLRAASGVKQRIVDAGEHLKPIARWR